MKSIKNFLILLVLVWVSEGIAQKSEEFDVTFEQDVTVEGRFEANSTTKPNRPCSKFTQAERNLLPSPESGDCVFNTTTNQLNIHNGSDWASAGGGGISNWATATEYKANDVVIESLKIYQANTDHTSTVFASDIANWTLISDNLPIDLTTDVTDVLPMANGGTDKNLTPTLGGVVYTDANSMEVLAAGTSGQVLKSNGAAAPTWQDASNKIEGLGQTESEFNKVQFKNKSVTETAAGVQLVETERSLLANGSFEHLSYQSSWTITGSATISRETSIVRDGKASFKAVTTGNSFRLEQTTTQLSGTNVSAYAVVWVNNTAAGVQICSMLAGSDKDCVTALTDGKWQSYIIPMVLGATSNGISVHSGTTAGTTYVDWVRLVDEDLVGTSPAIGPRVQYTPTFTGFGVVTNVNCYGQQIGTNELIECTFTSGTSTAVEARLSLRSGLTSTSSTPSLAIAGYGVISAASTGQYVTLFEPNVSYLTFGVQQSTAGLSKLNGNSFISSGQTYSFKALVPVAQYASSVPTYSDRCRDQINCETELSFSRDTSNVISSPIPFATAWAPTCTGTSTITCDITTGKFSVAPKCWGIREGDYGVTWNASSVSTTSVVIPIVNPAGSPTNVNARVFCQRQGQDYINAKVNQIVGSFKDYVRTPNTTTGKVGFCSAKISATGVISDQLGGCFASCTNATTPVCTFTSNYWKSGSVPNCSQSGFGGLLGQSLETTTTYYGELTNTSGAAVSGARKYFCHGEIQ